MDVQHQSSGVRKSSLGFIVYMVAFAGFGYQSFLISDEYFHYPTITRFQIMDYLSVMPTPKLVVGFAVPNATTGMSLKDIFLMVKDSVVLSYGKVKESAFEYSEGKINNARDSGLSTLIDAKGSFRMGRYLVSLSPKKNITYSPSATFLDESPLYVLGLSVNLTWNFQEKPQLFMTSLNSDIEGTKAKLPLTVPCGKKETICASELIYSIKITELLSPPYDTNCRQYQSDGYTSKDNCYSQCLNTLTAKQGKIIESNVIETERYANSSMKLLPWYFRYPSLLKRMHNFQTSDWSSVEQHAKECSESCRQDDCHVVSLVPEYKMGRVGGQSLERLLKYRKFQLPNMKRFFLLELYPPRNPAITVTSQEKLSIIDFIVYITSSMSTWFGFCPLQAASRSRIRKTFLAFRRSFEVLLGWSAFRPRCQQETISIITTHQLEPRL